MAKKAKVTKAQLGITELAKAMKLKPASVRMKLRAAKIKRTGKGYAFASMAEVNKVAKQLAA